MLCAHMTSLCTERERKLFGVSSYKGRNSTVMTPIKPLLPPTDPISKHHHLGVVVRTSAYEFYGDTSIQFTTAAIREV